MGSSNRDYMQDDYDTRQRSWGDDVPTTKWLMIVTVAAFVLQLMITHETVISGDDGPVSVMRNESSYIEEWFALDAGKVLHGQVWRLATYFFCNPVHNPYNLLFNMIGLWFLGSVLERMYGSRELLWFYLTSGVVCGVIFTAFGLKLNLPSPLMGAGSCVMALFCLYATHFPRQEILFFWLIPMQIRVVLLIYIVMDVFSILSAYKGHTPWQVVAYTSELWGIAFGYLYRRMNWKLSEFADMFDFRRLQRSIRRANTARNLRVFQPEPTTNLDEQVDAILAKIHEHGSESLTERERAILQKASEQAKNRL